jgi:hypothetical protein
MAKKSKTNLGSTPGLHAKRAKQLIDLIALQAKRSERLAKNNKCALALESYEDSIYASGEYHGHVDAIGKHDVAFRKAIYPSFNTAMHEQLNAHTAFKMHCVRKKET